MKHFGRRAAVWMSTGLTIAIGACGSGGGGSTTPPPPVTYILQVNSASPASGVAITVTPADNNSATNGTTSFSRTYNSGVAVVLTAPATAGGNKFSAWSGCTSASTTTCNVTIGANTTVTATYSPVAITPNPATVTIGSTQQFAATINGTASTAVTWTVAAPSGSSLSPGTITSAGLYTTPYPAPPTVSVTATSTANTAQSGSVTVTLTPPATTAGPALSVNVGSPTGAISPDIYGMDAYLLGATPADVAAVAKTNITVDRWGGDSTERYNYQLDVTNSIDDWYFENGGGTGGDAWPVVNGVKAFDALVQSNNSNGIKTLGTVPVLGWVAKDSTSCSFPQSTYPNQLAVNGKPAFSNDGRACGSGIYPNGVAGCTSANGCNIPSDPTVTSIAEPPPAPPAASGVNAAWANATWSGGWVNYLVNKFGPGNSGKGVAIYDLDNEPTWWYSNDADVHPLPFTYDEVTNGGIGTALAIKTADPTAQVSGPVIDFWWAYFYSMKDVTSGWSSGGPCYQPWTNPVDRKAHNGVPLIEYYLQQFAAAQTTYGVRLLDYVDLHTYFAASYPFVNGSGLGLAPAGDTGAQQARLNSTRAFWDPAYTDPSNNYPQPNYPTDSNYTGATDCNPPQQAPQLIRMMKSWVAKDYPGTKTAIDEYNFGGMEAINGALTQADILGIFGREGLDLGTMWPTTDPSTQIPGMMAFQIYRNYDGNKSTFGNTALTSTSANQNALSVYGALRSSDSAVTVVVINKTYGDLTDTVALTGLATSTTSAQAWLYSNANLTAIVAQPAVTVTPPATGGTSSTITTTFPAQSITLLVIPN
ncbi:MAG: glycoside hydrolase family 44 protein [Terracidiphilus sp.]